MAKQQKTKEDIPSFLSLEMTGMILKPVGVYGCSDVFGLMNGKSGQEICSVAWKITESFHAWAYP